MRVREPAWLAEEKPDLDRGSLIISRAASLSLPAPATDSLSRVSLCSTPSGVSTLSAARTSSHPRSQRQVECEYVPSFPTHPEWAGKSPAPPPRMPPAAGV